MSIEKFLTRLESKTLEFKENTQPKDKILSTCIAFANTAGGALLIGVSDKRQPLGIKDPHTEAEKIASFLNDSIEPRIFPNIEILEWKALYFIKIEVYPSSLRPHYEKSKGKLKGTYIRIGSTTRVADTDLIASIERSLSFKAFDEEICIESSYEDFDFNAASDYFAPKKILTKNDLISLNLVGKEQNNLFPTVGGVLLFGKKRLQLFPEAYIKAGFFEGIDKTTILSTKDIISYFPSALEEGIAFIRNSLGVGIKINQLKNEEVWAIPRVALREALINAVVHSDYLLRGAPIQIAVFSNRVEIENSGCLPWGLSIEEIKQGISKLRNPVMARTFFELGLIERWGSGIRRMIKACEEAGLAPPSFEEIGARIRVTFFLEKKTAPVPDVTDNKLIQALSENINTTHSISKAVGLSTRTTRSRLLRLVNLGLIAEVSKNSNDPKKSYQLIENPKSGLQGDSVPPILLV